MKCNKECKYFCSIANTEETNLGICSRNKNCLMTDIMRECPYVFEPYKCKDCIHYIERDSACMTASPEDKVGGCPGFEDHNFYKLISILFEWNQRGINCKEKFHEALKQAKDI